MKRKIILTCALTGGGDYGPNSKYVPVTPEQIASEALAAAKAGAASVHIHVRDPDTNEPSMEFKLYEEVVSRIRDSGSDVLINLTTGPGSFYTPPLEEGEEPEHVVMTPISRTIHIEKLKPDLCTLDVATMNFGPNAVVNTLPHLRAQAKIIKDAGVMPELEVFDLGHVDQALNLVKEGTIAGPPFFQFCLGLSGAAPATAESMMAMRSLLPSGTIWSGFGLSQAQMPMVALSVILGGHCRVGLEDNLYWERGVLAKSNAALVERAVTIIDALGAEVATPAEAREILSLPKSVSA